MPRAVWYSPTCSGIAQQKFDPRFMIDLATLTGAIVVIALGHEYAGFFSNDEELTQRLHAYGRGHRREESGACRWGRHTTS